MPLDVARQVYARMTRDIDLVRGGPGAGSGAGAGVPPTREMCVALCREWAVLFPGPAHAARIADAAAGPPSELDVTAAAALMAPPVPAAPGHCPH